MKMFAAIFAVGAIAVMGGNMAMASSDPSSASVNQSEPHVIAVLVHVDSAGHVTRVLPSTPLPPTLQKQLVENVDQWVVGPAVNKRHRDMNSSMIMKVALNAAPRQDGNYDVKFVYLSAASAPYSSTASHWLNRDGRLTLVNDTGAEASAQPKRYPDPEELVGAPGSKFH